MTPPQSALAEFHLLPPGSQDDKELTLAFKSGEKGAYQVIYDRYSTRVHGVCRRMLNQPDDAQEAAQETFLRVYQALGKFNGRYQLGPWITRIATNVCLDQLRSKSRRPAPASVELADLDPIETTPDFDPEALVIRRSESKRVRKVLESLPPMHRAAIVLRDFEGLTYEEVAVALGITECQTKALLHRARSGFKRTWTSTGLASLFIPWRLVQRVRRPGAALKEGAGNAANSATHVVEASVPTVQSLSTCSTVLQHCGQFMTDKAAAVFTAVVVGGASVGGAAVASNTQRAEDPPQQTAARDSHPQPAVDKKRTVRKDPKTIVVPAAVPQEEEPAPPPAPPSGQEGEDDAPSNEPSGSGRGEGGTPPSPPAPTPTPTPTPQPFTAALGFARGGSATAVAPRVNQVQLDCVGKTMTQHLETTIADGATSYPAVLDLQVRSSTTRLTLRVWKDGRQIDYASWGAEPVATWSGSGRQTRVDVSGSYGPLYGSEPDKVGLPSSGTFSGSLTFDCVARSLTSEAVSFASE